MKHFFVVILAWALLTGPALAERSHRPVARAKGSTCARLGVPVDQIPVQRPFRLGPFVVRTSS